MTLAELLAEIKRLDEAATKGPWTAREPTGQTISPRDEKGRRFMLLHAPANKFLGRLEEFPDCAEITANNIDTDAAFIAFARTALPRLARVAERAMALREMWDEFVDDMDERIAAFDRAARGDE